MADSVQGDSEENSPLLTLEDIHQSYGNVNVLEDVSLRVSEATMTAIVGPNGSGKTTLSQIIAGLSQPSSGQVTLHAETERPVGYLPQNPQFRPMFTVEETLEFYARFLTNPVSVEDVMEQVGLHDVRNRRVDALSGGMRRLLGLAQGFLGSPPLLVLDEPTSGLDPRMTQHIFDVIEQLVADGTSVTLTTHDLAYAERADDLIVLHRGHILAHTPPDTLLTQTSTESLSAAFFAMVGTEPTVQSGVQEDEQ